jgi:prepilin-type N-terminal cleavage/methylation domain-containing protein
MRAWYMVMHSKPKKDSQQGFSLIEVVIAIGLLGIIAVVIFTALRGSTSSLITADIRTTAESLARSEMEYIKKYSYMSGNYPLQAVPSEYGGFAVSNNVTELQVGLEKVKISVSYRDKLVLELEDYKAR